MSSRLKMSFKMEKRNTATPYRFHRALLRVTDEPREGAVGRTDDPSCMLSPYTPVFHPVWTLSPSFYVGGGTGMRSQGSSSGTTCAPVLRDLMWGLLCWGASEQASPHSGQGTHSPPGIWTCSPRGHCMGMNKMEPKMETVSSALLHSTPPIFVTHTVLIPPRCPWSHIPGGPCIPMLQQYKQP